MNCLTHNIQDISILISNYLCWIIDRNYCPVPKFLTLKSYNLRYLIYRYS
ncbi:hypothetical protein MHK_010578 [Candidatus Magnetomorum sp. HK-1]|nr:hypothetical protein MHK_010578 [Candidatus Magnetomorum sp. HK-1]